MCEALDGVARAGRHRGGGGNGRFWLACGASDGVAQVVGDPERGSGAHERKRGRRLPSEPVGRAEWASASRWVGGRGGGDGAENAGGRSRGVAVAAYLCGDGGVAGSVAGGGGAHGAMAHT